MPFTFAHPAAVLPLRRTRLVFSALVIGSMIPDVEFYGNLETHRRTWHEWPGFLTHAWMFGILGYLIFRLLMEQPLRDLVPERLRRHLPPYQPWWPIRLADLVLAVVSVGIGLATHLVWDSLTHDGGAIWRLISSFPWVRALDQRLVFPAYVFLQHGSTFLGFAVLVWFFLPRLRFSSATESAEHPNRRRARHYSWLILGVMAVCSCGFGWHHGDPLRFSPAQHELLRDALVFSLLMTVRTLFFCVLGWTIAWHLWRLFRRGQPEP